ncbi:MAG: methyltransferase domain-containing protein [Acidobacteriota bacterium]|nr:methyltransferase domain-containing protein [Acidobacteriota bacterium]
MVFPNFARIMYSVFVFEQRSPELELIDTGDYTPEEYEGCLRELRRINRWLGDQRALEETLLREIERKNLKQFTVLDVGAGSGELLRVIARFARKSGRKSQLCGLELNSRSAEAILEESKDFTEICSIRGDALRLPFTDNSFDYAICSLFTHHFADEKVIEILSEMQRVASRKIFAIDLHRDRRAYFFYTTIGKIFLHNRLIRHDGALSILRSFVPEELESLGKQAGLEKVSVTKHFPARLVLQGEAQPK